MKIATNELKPDSLSIYLIARALDEDIKEFFENPENEKKFQEWKSKKEVSKVWDWNNSESQGEGNKKNLPKR